MARKTQNPLSIQPVEFKAQIVKAIKKALIQERNIGNLPSTCRIQIGWIERVRGKELHITISGLNLKSHLPKLGKDGKLILSSDNKKMNDTLKKVLKNNKIDNFYIETRYGDADNTQKEKE